MNNVELHKNQNCNLYYFRSSYNGFDKTLANLEKKKKVWTGLKKKKNRTTGKKSIKFKII